MYKFGKIITFLLTVYLLFPTDSQSRIVDTIEALQKKSIGEQTAPIKMIEFASLTCGH